MVANSHWQFWVKILENLRNLYANLKWAVISSTLLVLPFIILEWVNRRAFGEGFPIALFGLMWLLQVGFGVILTPIVRNVRSGKGIMGNPISLVIRGILLILLAFLWVSIVLDQMPCFLGVPNCD